MLIDLTGCVGVTEGRKMQPGPVREPAVLMTQKFALPRPAKSKIDEAAGRSLPVLPQMSSVSTC